MAAQETNQELSKAPEAAFKEVEQNNGIRSSVDLFKHRYMDFERMEEITLELIPVLDNSFGNFIIRIKSESLVQVIF